MNNDLQWLQQAVDTPNVHASAAAQSHQRALTKPPGSLGRVEDLAVHIAALQKTTRPQVDPAYICVFVADHGIANEGVSAFPQVVTKEMIRNFANGGAAISVLARELDASLEVVNLGTATELEALKNVTHCKLGPGTTNFKCAPAMDARQLTNALLAGRQSVQRARAHGAKLYIAGEMGIANSTSATALACAMLGKDAEALTGYGTGISRRMRKHKIEVIQQALDYHQPDQHGPVEILRRLGGFEIAALTGSYIRCAQMGVPVLVDGFICSTAALVAEHICPGAKSWFIFSHRSAERGHRLVLKALAAKPLLDLGMRLGEASGAAMALPVLRCACALHNEMATFHDAGVSNKLS